MSPEAVITVVQRALETLILIASPMLLAALVTGLLVSVFQAATQINEATLSFIPKLLVMFLVMVFAGPWMLTQMMEYTTRLLTSIPSMIG